MSKMSPSGSPYLHYLVTWECKTLLWLMLVQAGKTLSVYNLDIVFKMVKNRILDIIRLDLFLSKYREKIYMFKMDVLTFWSKFQIY